jgi:hypothetical protein
LWRADERLAQHAVAEWCKTTLTLGEGRQVGEVEKADRPFDAERQQVLGELRQVVEAWGQESKRRVLFGSELNAWVRELLLRGSAAGVPVKAMAEAGGLTRRWAHAEIRRAQREATRRERTDVRQLTSDVH